MVISKKVSITCFSCSSTNMIIVECESGGSVSHSKLRETVVFCVKCGKNLFRTVHNDGKHLKRCREAL